MPNHTLLDKALDHQYSLVSEETGLLEVGFANKDNLKLPMIAGAPPTVGDFIKQQCSLNGECEFLIWRNERVTFGEAFTIASALAHGLIARYGIQPGDRVGIAMRNSPSWVIGFMATILAGGVATLLNGWWQARELTKAIDDAGCRLVIADLPRGERIAGASQVPMIVVDDDLPLRDAFADVLDGGVGVFELPRASPEDYATILFTSGSTGASKGAVSTHRAVMQGVFNTLLQFRILAAVLGEAPAARPVALLNLPLFHVTAEISLLLTGFALGRSLVIMPRWNAEEAMRLIERERVTTFYGVPLMSFELMTHPDRDRYDLSSVSDFVAGGAARPPEHVRRLDAAFAGAPMTGYGLTETQGSGTLNVRGNYLAKPASVGRVCRPLIEMAIRDETGQNLPRYAAGEVCIRSAALFSGYWNDPAATAAAFTADGFFRTGDIGYLDEEDYLFLVDRKKDIIIRGGENISCQEVEAALYAHPDVREAAVFGIADERLGEVPAAVVHPHPEAAVSPEALREFLSGRIAAFKVPARVWFTEERLPRLGTEKIDKVALRDHYRQLAAVSPIASPA